MTLSSGTKEASSPFPILMYHSVSSRSSRGFQPFTVTPEQFELHLRHMSDAGYKSWTVSGLMDALREDKNAARKAVVITFDDGFADFYTAALPALARCEFTATVYVVSGAVGGRSAWFDKGGDDGREMLLPAQLREMSTLGIEIGAHSVSHPALDRIPALKAQEEICGSKLALEDILGAEVRSFAYPFGYHSKAVRDIVRDAGYDSACAVRYRMSSVEDNRFALSRLFVRHGVNAAGLRTVNRE